MAPDDRKIKCTTRLGALDVPRSSAHKAEEFAGFRTLCEVRLLLSNMVRGGAIWSAVSFSSRTGIPSDPVVLFISSRLRDVKTISTGISSSF